MALPHRSPRAWPKLVQGQESPGLRGGLSHLSGLLELTFHL